ncbi:DUF2218 domain-containing protein [Ancylobacter sp. 6x-1]|uniref:DUF2218 domain-containing protein n=1 Tax=Ancylobacter crimeensis TaxID=2579147 RepID=A0ABT0DCT2_9HYPH|nr:DUF2218 domain-containing protein [Ancylobacter crimeensis]MCK0197770.1 DUF2218 domain-containing protein [Ancylobacter crimeensis]
MTETIPAETNLPTAGALRCRVPTTHASRYLQQLCKHWSHKLDVTFTPEAGRVVLPDDAVLTLAADGEGLEIGLAAPDQAVLERMTGVVERHLDRFAFREAPLPFAWQPAAEPAP